MDGFLSNLIFTYFLASKSRKFKFHKNLTRITGTLHEDQYTFLIIPCSVLLTVTNVSDKSRRENQNTRFVFSNFFFFENHAVCGIMWKNTVEPDRPQTTIRRIRIACWISKSTNTHSEYVTLTAFPCNNGCTNGPHCNVIHTLTVVMVHKVFTYYIKHVLQFKCGAALLKGCLSI